MREPALFLDRDGTIIEDRGHLSDPSQVCFYPETIDALHRLEKDFALFIITNQSGISSGIIRHEDARRVNEHVVDHLGAAGIVIQAVYMCPHQRTDGCPCIKPKPYSLEKAAEEHGVDLGFSFVIGDHPSDVELAVNVGARGIYVLSGHGQKHRAELQYCDVVVSGIGAAAVWILHQIEQFSISAAGPQ